MVVKQNNHWSEGRPLHMQIGFIMSLSFVLIAFDWEIDDPKPLVSLGSSEPEIIEMIYISNIKEDPPPPPSPSEGSYPCIEIVEDEGEVSKEIIEEPPGPQPELVLC
ncbi:hypothetical protein AAG747_11440 [Rapidithrix thailandica]|uniref:Uncharacterized protein n=1 Tax=Rapidithrix thailandica TaxID=413964 RepID=A0AAW9S4T7_9BACT